MDPRGDRFRGCARATADAHRAEEQALREQADATRRAAAAFRAAAEIETREADADPDPPRAQTRRHHAELSIRHAEALEELAATTLTEADTAGTYAAAAEERAREMPEVGEGEEHHPPA